MILRFGRRRLNIDFSVAEVDPAVEQNPMPGAEDAELVRFLKGPVQDIEGARYEGLRLYYGGPRLTN